MHFYEFEFCDCLCVLVWIEWGSLIHNTLCELYSPGGKLAIVYLSQHGAPLDSFQYVQVSYWGAQN